MPFFCLLLPTKKNLAPNFRVCLFRGFPSMVILMTGVFIRQRKSLPALRARQWAGKLKQLTDRGTYSLPELNKVLWESSTDCFYWQMDTSSAAYAQRARDFSNIMISGDFSGSERQRHPQNHFGNRRGHPILLTSDDEPLGLCPCDSEASCPLEELPLTETGAPERGCLL